MPLDNAIQRMREADADLTATIERGMRGYATLAELEEREYRRFKRELLKTLLFIGAGIVVGTLGVLASLGKLP